MQTIYTPGTLAHLWDVVSSNPIAMPSLALIAVILACAFVANRT